MTALASRPVRRAGLTALALAALVLIGHGGALSDGYFFDDHWHRVTLRSGGWGWSDLVEAATFDLPGPLTNLWWQTEPLQWRYARPVAMLAMKLAHLVTDSDPRLVHLAGLGWHWLASLLVASLAAWMLARHPTAGARAPAWALLAGGLFALNPHAVFTVGWVAAQNALVSGVLLLAAMRAFLAASFDGAVPRRRCSPPWLAIAIAAWLGALFARESAIVFAVLILLCDVGFGGWGHLRRRWWVHALAWGLTIGYLAWRLLVFPRAGAPSIYFTPPEGPAYLAWAAARLVHLLFAQVFYSPLFLGLDGALTERALTLAVLGGLLALVLAGYVLATRRVPGRWVWPLWMVAAFAPVVPVFVMPHFAYVPAAAYAVMVTLLLLGLTRRLRIVLGLVVLIGTVGTHYLYRDVWRGIVRAEQLVFADITEQDGAPPPGTHVVFVNLPVAAIYAPVALRTAWQQPDLTGHVLTFAPHPLQMAVPFGISRAGERDLVLTIDPPGYFAGVAGEMLIGGMRRGDDLPARATITGELFDAIVEERGPAGITRLRFSFHQPLDSPHLRIYVSSAERPAWRLRFDAAAAGGVATPDAAENLAWQVRHAEALEARARFFRIHGFYQRLVRSDVLLTGD